MKLEEFLRQTQADVRTQVANRLAEPGPAYPYEESTFAEVVMQHMADIGMTSEPNVCHYAAKVSNATVRLSGWALSEGTDQLDLFVCVYNGVDEISPISDTETKTAAEHCLRFLEKSASRRLSATMDESNDAYLLALTIEESYASLDQIRVYVLTDRQAKSKSFKAREIEGKLVKLEVMDIERLHRHWSEGKPRDDLVVDFREVCGEPIPCVYVPGITEGATEYDYALTAIPGEALRFIYEKYGSRLLEANVRSFLSVTGKVNRGIRDTLRTAPGRFMAYNNGIVVVVDELRLGDSQGGTGIAWMKGMQIVNGGQTTASIYFTKRKNPEIDLGQVRVPAKILVMKTVSSPDQEALISDISRYANSQNSVKVSDLSANKPYHVELEKLAMTTYCPDGVGRWFYERAAGSYNVMLQRETTPARQKQMKESIPTSRKLTKTDLAKYMNAWGEQPHLVSLGAQKNFERFTDAMSVPEEGIQPALPEVSTYKEIIAKAILFKAVSRLIRPSFPAFQANITAYVVALLSNRLGPRLSLEKIWLKQRISAELEQLTVTWAREVNKILHDTASGRMISEWAKKPECWAAVRGATYSAPGESIPELR